MVGWSTEGELGERGVIDSLCPAEAVVGVIEVTDTTGVGVETIPCGTLKTITE